MTINYDEYKILANMLKKEEENQLSKEKENQLLEEKKNQLLEEKKKFISLVTNFEENKQLVNNKKILFERLIKLENVQKNVSNGVEEDEYRKFALSVTNVIYITIFSDFELIYNDLSRTQIYDNLLFNLKRNCEENKKKLFIEEKKLLIMEKHILDILEKIKNFKEVITNLKKGNWFTDILNLTKQSEIKKNNLSEQFLKDYIQYITKNNEYIFKKLKVDYLQDIDYCEIFNLINK